MYLIWVIGSGLIAALFVLSVKLINFIRENDAMHKQHDLNIEHVRNEIKEKDLKLKDQDLKIKEIEFMLRNQEYILKDIEEKNKLYSSSVFERFKELSTNISILNESLQNMKIDCALHASKTNKNNERWT